MPRHDRPTLGEGRATAGGLPLGLPVCLLTPSVYPPVPPVPVPTPTPPPPPILPRALAAEGMLPESAGEGMTPNPVLPGGLGPKGGRQEGRPSPPPGVCTVYAPVAVDPVDGVLARPSGELLLTL